MDFETFDCNRCGGSLREIDENTYKCNYCGKTFHKKDAENHTKTFRDMFDEMKREHVKNLRRNLYDAVNAEYISNFEVKMRCEELKKFIPDDFAACFYEVAIGNNVRQLTKYLRKIDVVKNYDEIESVVKFLIRSLQTEYQLELNNLIARAYEYRDPERFEKYCTELSGEAIKVDAGVYETKLPREVFIAYSSKDMDKVSELCEFLESQGLKCFVAARNLRHGKGAVENYNKALEEAMDHCRSLVFVSSMNSRSFNCDALTIELPYIQQKDLESAPAEYKNNYKGLPQEYKKPRVEYRIGESLSGNVADAISNEIFDGYERVYSPEEVAERVMKQLVAQSDRKTNKKKGAPAPQVIYTDAPADEKQRVAQIFRRVEKAIAENEWGEAASACERALDIDPESAEAYVYKLMIDLKVKSRDDLGKVKASFVNNTNYKKAIKYADNELATMINGYVAEIDEWLDHAKKQSIYNSAIMAMESNTLSGYQDALENLRQIPAFMDSDRQAKLCQSKIDELEAEIAAQLEAQRKAKIKALKTTAIAVALVCAVAMLAILAYIFIVRPVVYSNAVQLFESGSFEEAKNIFNEDLEYNDAELMVAYCDFAMGNANPLRRYIQANNLTEIAIPYGVKDIVSDAFRDCSSLTSVVIPDSVTSIGGGAFYYCESLTSVVIPDSVTSIGNYAFYYCESLTSVVIPDSVTSIGSEAFKDCESLTSIDIPDSVTRIGYEAFYKCTSITSVTIGNGVTSIGSYAFSDCTNLTSVVIPDSVTSIGFSAFGGCTSLTSVTIGNGVTSIDDWAFGSCTSLTSIDIPDSVTIIGNRAFSDCTSLTSVVIPDSVTSIGDSAFGDCTGLTSVTIGNSVTSIGFSTFNGCTSLTSINYSGTKAQWETIGKGDVWDFGTGNYTVYCTDGEIQK